MAEQSEQEKTEDPTQRRLQQAREDGRVARSQELSTATLLLGAALTITMLAPSAGGQLLQLVGESLSRLGEARDAANVLRLIEHSGWSMLMIVAVLCAATALLALATGAVQARGTLTPKPLAPKWNRVSPLANGKNLVSSKALVELLKALAKVALIALCTYVVLRRAWPDLLDLGARDAQSLLAVLRQTGVRLFFVAGGAFALLAAGDFGWQLWQHQQQLKMTKEEVKQEMKQTDGDPMLKSRVRAMARARLRKQMMAAVPKADVIIVNPTHRAVALQYDPMTAPAPIVLAMGERKVAERIKEIAKQHGIPMIENKPLAIALIASAKVGMMIPAELYVAVAEILAFVFRQRALRGEQPSWVRGAN
ncbi:MAG: flagellar biosynthesis protein FlhB [Gemmatimonadaceae bacterium]|nr:flagellar biosynthesis protein FlhB [Gemmatimonadaceae bacterium]